MPTYLSVLTGFLCQHTSSTTVPAAAMMAGIMYHQIDGNGSESTVPHRWLCLVTVLVLNITCRKFIYKQLCKTKFKLEFGDLYFIKTC